MICIDCDGKTSVYDTVEYEGVVYRKRKCAICGRKFKTIEDIIFDDDKDAKRAFYLKNSGQNRKEV